MTQDPLKPRRRIDKSGRLMAETCRDCDRPVMSRGLCRSHYRKAARRAKLDKLRASG